ncbi:MAG: histone [Chlamydiales bacterium]|nr:histone [Chlamydiales bacterium]
MALNQTVNQLRELLSGIQSDLEKAIGGNKAASQRVRTGTVALEKVAKTYRKESIVTEKKTKGRSSKPAAASKKKPAAKAAAAKPAAKAKPKAKAKAAAPRPLSVKRPATKSRARF